MDACFHCTLAPAATIIFGIMAVARASPLQLIMASVLCSEVGFGAGGSSRDGIWAHGSERIMWSHCWAAASARDEHARMHAFVFYIRTLAAAHSRRAARVSSQGGVSLNTPWQLSGLSSTRHLNSAYDRITLWYDKEHQRLSRVCVYMCTCTLSWRALWCCSLRFKNTNSFRLA